MKVIDEKGRLFKKINVVDLIALVVVVLVVAGVLWKLLGPSVSDAVAPQVTMTTVMRVRGVNSFMLNELEQNPQDGKKLVNGNQFIEATIDSVTFEPYVVQTITADGRVVNAEDPSKCDMILEISSRVPQGTANPTIGNQEVRAGRTFTLKTNDFETIANIESVRFGD